MSGHLRDTWRAVIVIVVVVVLANGSYTIFGNVASPIWWTANLSTHVCNWYCGAPTIDPNVGFITQPLGHLAASDLLHGHLPWWNYFEGMGQPLVGEMQSAALFPLVLLFLLPAGLLLFHLALQVIAGISCYLLIRRLGVGFTLATLGAVLFALNGTFAWIGNAAVNPICFLPMLILGIEMSLDTALATRRAGLTVIAAALALSIYAGFPEMAYLDGLLCAGWALTRLVTLEGSRRLAALVRLGVGAAMGFALSLPVLVPFFGFVGVANIGDHASDVLGTTTTAASTLTLLVNPYAGGALFGGAPSTPYNLLGYVTASVAVFAVAGLWGRRLRPLRFFLAGWVVAVLAGALNFLGVRRVWNLLPQMSSVAFARYVWPSVEFAVIVLAMLGLSDLVEHAARRVVAQWSVLGVALVAFAAALLIAPFDGHERGSLKVALIILIVVPFVALAVIGFSLRFLSGKALLTTCTAVLALESFAFFAVPTYRTPASVTVVNGSIAYLQRHEGLGRFLSLGVINPNWGSQYSLNEINAIDLPLPANFSRYIAADLAPSEPDPRIFIQPFTTSVQDDVATHLANYEALGVAYIVTPPKRLDAALAGVGLTLVFHDAVSNVYQLAHPSSYYSTALASCVLSHTSVDHVTVTCAQATTLTRLELALSGWTATVNGVATALTSSNGLVQTLEVPAGTSSVAFSYLPPHEQVASAGALVALLALLATWVPRVRLRRRATMVEG